MKEYLKLGRNLLIICIIAALSLGVVNGLTKDIIAENRDISSSDLVELLPGAVNKKEISTDNVDKEAKAYVDKAFEVSGDNGLVGYVFKVVTGGFHGDIEMFVAISKDDKLSGIKITSQSETAGLGARISEANFMAGFQNKTIDKGITMTKKGASKDNEVDAITGATVSSTAVGKGVNTAIAFYMQTIKGVEFNLSDADSTSSATGEGSESDTSSSATGESEGDADTTSEASVSE
ncbi:MAG: RnfABCDGE type electron transport complex subunit G [Clostridiales bacterium]|uniref:RnfABCDGE type electron transport complex subunit G n=1 Tax=Clostridium sp. N3C TaxID=1776758 RepID=UPI00092E1636|nr:RnfABCDGE type electron transport complex subunit G [Clostridium sp. N3C]NLZ48753.1 RnfABCDGE type electron transport complex subunit G [Clostridiales bacterium]SCN23066.1 Nitrogen fixation protein RnfG [Clostridium sp. N3C]